MKSIVSMWQLATKQTNRLQQTAYFDSNDGLGDVHYYLTSESSAQSSTVWSTKHLLLSRGNLSLRKTEAWKLTNNHLSAGLKNKEDSYLTFLGRPIGYIK